MDCKNKKLNEAKCTCTYPACSRHGVCCECIDYHLKNNELPACYFDKKAERTYDRSLGNFIRTKNGL